MTTRMQSGSARWSAVLIGCLTACASCAAPSTRDGEQTVRRSALAVPATTIAAGSSNICALLQTGRVACWGAGGLGQLGNGSTADSSTPVLVSGLDDAIAISAGGAHTCALRATGAVVCWGSSEDGQLGDGSVGSGTFSSVPVNAGGLSDYVDVAAGTRHTCAVRQTGEARCWGADDDGQLGNGTAGASAVPVAVSGRSDFVRIAAGQQHSCAVSAAGRGYCWGYGGADSIRGPYSPLGNATTGNSDVPVTVMTSSAFALEDAVDVAAGWTHSCALLGSGGVACWGDNGLGQIGNGSDRFTTVAVHVVDLADATAITTGQYHSSALRATGNIVGWGDGGEGQLGNGTTAAPIVAPDEVLDFSDFVAVSAGRIDTCGVRAGGDVICWGTVPRTTPVISPFPFPITGFSDGAGKTCSGADPCFSGFCVDGFCCDTSCGNGDLTDCQACSVAAGSTADGTCAPRAAGACTDDGNPCTTDRCDGTGAACQHAPGNAGVSCRLPAGTCDREDFCDGVSSVCADAVRASGSVCTDDGNPCTTDRCDGSSTACQHPPGNAGAPCYTAANVCEADEVCDGATATCPPTTVLPPDSCQEVVQAPGSGDTTVPLLGWNVTDPAASPAGAVLVVFTDVTGSGHMAAVQDGSGPAPAPGFEIAGDDDPIYWHLESSGFTYTPPITVCIKYDEAWFDDPTDPTDAFNETLLQLHHDDGSGSGFQPARNLFLDTTSNIVCGDVDSLSPFTIAHPLDVGPVFHNVPDTIVVEAPSHVGTKVRYREPTAFDAIDGPRPVCCEPPSGSRFPIGKTTVSCTASDRHGHTSQVRFVVSVKNGNPGRG